MSGSKGPQISRRFAKGLMAEVDDELPVLAEIGYGSKDDYGPIAIASPSSFLLRPAVALAVHKEAYAAVMPKL